jgi:4-amino-4-deoxy-L-arabinose transferase-like glycosyltransferase
MQTSTITDNVNSKFSPQKTKWILGGIFFFSVIFRVAVSFYLGNTVEILPGTHDQVSYHNLAVRFINGYGFTFGERWWPITAADTPTAHWSYLYTFYLILVYSVFGPNPLIARIIQAIIVGILQPWVAYKIGHHIFNQKVGLVSAAITAFYIYFIYYSATLMTETFYILTVMVSLYFAIKLVEASRERQNKQITKFMLLLGLTLGTAVLLRQLVMLMIPFIFAWVWWSGRKTGQKSLIPALIGSGILIVVMIIPFTIYNYSRFDRFVLLNTNAGYAFFWGNHPIYGTRFESILPPEMGTYEGLIPVELHHLDEAALERELLNRGIQFILDDPGRYILLSLSRIPPYIMFWPSPESGLISNISRVFSFGIAWPFMLVGLFYAPFSRVLKEKLRLEAPLMLLYTFIVIYAGIHIMTWTLIRYRLPIDAILVIFAALILVHLWYFFWQKRENRKTSHLEMAN